MSANDEDLSTLERRADDLISNHENLLKGLVRMRVEHHLTQAQVAERMGVSQPTVAAFERYDANPTLSTIRRYAHAVGARIRDEVIDDCTLEQATSALQTRSSSGRWTTPSSEPDPATRWSTTRSVSWKPGPSRAMVLHG